MPFVNVKLIKGVFDAEQKQEMIRKLTDTMVEIEGEAMPRDLGHGRESQRPLGDRRQGPDHSGCARPSVQRRRLTDPVRHNVRGTRSPGGTTDDDQLTTDLAGPLDEHGPRPFLSFCPAARDDPGRRRRR